MIHWLKQPFLTHLFILIPVIYTIGLDIFNFNKSANNLDVKLFLFENSTLLCDCTLSWFVDKDDSKTLSHTNVSPKVKSIMKIELVIIRRLRKSIITNLCIQSWYDKHGVTSSSFFEWKQVVYQQLMQILIVSQPN